VKMKLLRLGIAGISMVGCGARDDGNLRCSLIRFFNAAKPIYTLCCSLVSRSHLNLSRTTHLSTAARTAMLRIIACSLILPTREYSSRSLAFQSPSSARFLTRAETLCVTKAFRPMLKGEADPKPSGSVVSSLRYRMFEYDRRVTHVHRCGRVM
jgi:hypothetical protein